MTPHSSEVLDYIDLLMLVYLCTSFLAFAKVLSCQGGSTVLAMAESVECFPIPVPCHILKVCIPRDVMP